MTDRDRATKKFYESVLSSTFEAARILFSLQSTIPTTSIAAATPAQSATASLMSG